MINLNTKIENNFNWKIILSKKDWSLYILNQMFDFFLKTQINKIKRKSILIITSFI